MSIILWKAHSRTSWIFGGSQNGSKWLQQGPGTRQQTNNKSMPKPVFLMRAHVNACSFGQTGGTRDNAIFLDYESECFRRCCVVLQLAISCRRVAAIFHGFCSGHSSCLGALDLTGKKTQGGPKLMTLCCYLCYMFLIYFITQVSVSRR